MADKDWETDQGGTMGTDINTDPEKDQGGTSQQPGGKKRRKGRKGGQVDRSSSDTGSGMGGDTGQGSGSMDDFDEG